MAKQQDWRSLRPVRTLTASEQSLTIECVLNTMAIWQERARKLALQPDLSADDQLSLTACNEHVNNLARLAATYEVGNSITIRR